MLGARPDPSGGGLDPGVVAIVLAATGVLALVATIVRGLRVRDPFLDPHLFRSASFSSATLVSGLTGYGFATAIVGGAVYVDRVLYGGPDEQRLALGALAAATALGALASGFLVRVLRLRIVTLVGLGASIVALLAMAGWTPDVSVEQAAIALGVFGAGFGLTVTPRSTAAVESVAREAYGIASSTVTVARMVGMAVGLAILTAYGSTTIDRLYDQVYATPDAYLEFIPESLRDRPLRDGLVVDALEAWAASEAARIMVGVFLVAAVVTAVAVPPSLLLDRRGRMLAPPGTRRGWTNRHRPHRLRRPGPARRAPTTGRRCASSPGRAARPGSCRAWTPSVPRSPSRTRGSGWTSPRTTRTSSGRSRSCSSSTR
jgi:MFS family permease